MIKQNRMGSILTLLYFLSLSSCVQQSNKPIESLSSTEGSCSSDTGTHHHENKIFKLEGKIFTKKDLPADMREIIYKNNYEAYTKNLSVYKDYALRHYLGKKKNLLKDPKNLPQIDEVLEIQQPSDKEAKVAFEQYKNRMPRGSTYEQMKSQIMRFLVTRNTRNTFDEELTKMEKKGVFVSMVSAPEAQKVIFDLNSFPTKGKKNSKVNVVEISDYLCGHCQSAHPKVMELYKKYKDQISFTQINFSLRPTGLSGTYARGAYCALEQGPDNFWKFHDAAFKKTTVPHKHEKGDKHTSNDGNSTESISKVKDVAKSVGLDSSEFPKCLSSEKAKEYVQRNNSIISKKGINGTPVFIINNKKLARGIHELEEAIKNSL